MKKKVLITGASGFIGYHLIEKAQQAGYEVHAAVRPTSNVSRLEVLEPTFVHADYRSQKSLENLLEKEKYSFIIHAAGATRAKTEAAYNEVNATYSLRLAEAAKRVGHIQRFIFLSSLAALGPVAYTATEPIREDTLPTPVTRYGKSKLLAETYLKKVQGLPMTIIRPTAVYGPGEKDIFILFKTLKSKLDLYIGRQPQRLSFVYVEDLADATIKAMKEESIETKIYNISDGREYDRYKLADLFNKLSNNSAVRLHLPLPIVEMIAGFLELAYRLSHATPVLNREKLNELTAPNWNCSIELARQELNYAPQYDLEKGLTETLNWYKEHQWL